MGDMGNQSLGDPLACKYRMPESELDGTRPPTAYACPSRSSSIYNQQFPKIINKSCSRGKLLCQETAIPVYG